jgi:hypothetical protein
MDFEISKGFKDSIELIFQTSGSLCIEVTDLNKIEFVEDANEIQFYGNIDGRQIAFQTINYLEEDLCYMIDAIRFYASRLGFPFMEIVSQRQKHLA